MGIVASSEIFPVRLPVFVASCSGTAAYFSFFQRRFQLIFVSISYTISYFTSPFIPFANRRVASYPFV